MENGLQPDILVLRTERALSQGLRRKVALFCNVDANAVMESIDVPTIYEVPLRMHDQHLDEVVLSKLDLPADCEPDMEQWKAFVEKVKNPHHKIEIALVGKYTELPDAYKSIAAAYGATDIVERHRHRYEFNNDYLGDFESHGMIPAGVNPETGLVEVVELTGHPWFVGTQYHPEYKSTVQRPHPLFVAFVAAALKYSGN